MVKRDYYFTRPDNVKLFISYSDAGKKIEQSPTGILYDSAIDVENAPYTYMETNEPVENLMPNPETIIEN